MHLIKFLFFCFYFSVSAKYVIEFKYIRMKNDKLISNRRTVIKKYSSQKGWKFSERILAIERLREGHGWVVFSYSSYLFYSLQPMEILRLMHCSHTTSSSNKKLCHYYNIKWAYILQGFWNILNNQTNITYLLLLTSKN